MGPNAGNGMGGMDPGGMMQGNASNVPPATEYTLQGVMRFLQTEWHRHERERNAWEIENQEMRARIAHLEGQSRRADATQKALRKYVSILERKVKQQANVIRGGDAAAATEEKTADEDREAKIQEKLKGRCDSYHHASKILTHPAGSNEKETAPNVDGVELERTDDEVQRQELKLFLDQCQSEFMYLMIAPANPQPPRDSPPLPMIEDLREVDAYGVPISQQLDRHFSLPQRPAHPHMQDANARHHQAANASLTSQQSSALDQKLLSDLQSQAMARSVNETQQGNYSNANDWSISTPGTARIIGENDLSENISGHPPSSGIDQEKSANPQDGWVFPDTNLTDNGSMQHPNLIHNRPDTDVFPNAEYMPKSPGRMQGSRRKGSMSRRRSGEHDLGLGAALINDGSFKLRFGLRGHLDTVRTVIFSGGGSPAEPEICTAGDDGMIKRFHIPRIDGQGSHGDLDVTANFTHRGHRGAVLALTSWSPSPNFATGGRAQGDGWIFSGGQDSSIRVWERGRVDPKGTLDGHTDAVWTLCVLPTTLGAIFGTSSQYGSADRILLVSGAADGTVRLWSVSAPPQLSSPQPGSSRGMRGGRVRGNSMSSGSGFSNSPQPNTASNSPCHHTLVHVIERADKSEASPTSISPLSASGETFVVSYADAAVLVFDTRTGEQVGSMDSLETYDGSSKTSVNAVVASTVGLDQGSQHGGNMGEEDTSGPTGGRSMAGSGVEGTIITGHEDRFVRFFDANSGTYTCPDYRSLTLIFQGQCTYNMLAHPDAISSLSLSPDGRELVSAGHDASLRFWSLEKRSCVQEITSHRVMRGEGVCSCVWSHDGKWVVSGGGDGIVKVFAR